MLSYLTLTAHFNPRSREGSDIMPDILPLLHQYFNPRSREGSDCLLKLPGADVRISIHAPAKGATLFQTNIIITLKYFNPRSREGSDIHRINKAVTMCEFQSTLPRRERLFILPMNAED